MQQPDESGRRTRTVNIGRARLVPRKPDEVPRTLEQLALLSYSELLDLYGSLGVPSDLRTLDGALRGRMLALRGTRHGPAFFALARLGRWSGFPWEGKTLSAKSASEGTGVNRIRLPGLGLQQLFPFVTKFDSSDVDGRPCVFIDYANPDNPPYIRAIRDELREVSPGLFFGPVFLNRGRSETLVTWFGLQASGSSRAADA